MAVCQPRLASDVSRNKKAFAVHYAIAISAAFLCSACGEKSPQAAEAIQPAGQVSASELPNTAEATQALLEMLNMRELQNVEVRLGTCISAVQAEHPKQVACTVALKVGAGTSETQADFYRRGNKWVAQPSRSQDQLPFPDPKL